MRHRQAFPNWQRAINLLLMCGTLGLSLHGGEGTRSRFQELVPKPAPRQSIELNATDLEGCPIKLSELRGRVVLVHLWSSRCQVCESSVMELKNMAMKYERLGLSLIGVVSGDSAASVSSFVRSNGITWPQCLKRHSLLGGLHEEGKPLPMPGWWLLDKEGRLRFRGPVRNFEEKIQTLLAESP